MNDEKAIENICMAIPISKEEVKQVNLKMHTPHSWHNIAITDTTNLTWMTPTCMTKNTDVNPMYHKANKTTPNQHPTR
jgi:hypothetical protein